ncbi:MAG: methyltransferase domain-containing protein [Vicinamibacterales bacterium]
MDYLTEIDATTPDFAEYWDELPLWSAPFGMMLLDRVPLRTGTAMLDVGAGTGFLSIELAQRCGPASTVIAVDPWASVNARLQRKLAQLGLTNVTVLEQDASTLELPEASIDLVVSNLGINNFDDARAVLRVCASALKPGGHLALTTNIVGHMQEFYDVFRQTLGELGLHDALPSLEAHINHRATPESVTLMLSDTGFSHVAISRDVFRLRYADGSSFLRHAFIRLGFMPAWKQVVPANDVVRTFTALERNLNALAATHGELSLTIPMAYVEARNAV